MSFIVWLLLVQVLFYSVLTYFPSYFLTMPFPYYFPIPVYVMALSGIWCNILIVFLLLVRVWRKECSDW